MPSSRSRPSSVGCSGSDGESFAGMCAARRAVPGVGSYCGGRPCRPTPLRCSRRGRAAKLASLTSFVALEQSRRVRSGSARCARADPGAALLAAPQVAHPGHRPPRGNARAACRGARWCRQSRGMRRRKTRALLRGGRCPGWATCGAASSAGLRAARAARFVHLTRRDCSSAATGGSEASFAARPQTEQHSGVGLQGRPPQ